MRTPTGARPAALSKPAPWPAVVAAHFICSQQVWRIAVIYWVLDNKLIVGAVRKSHDGQSPYESKRFLCPPSSNPFALAQTTFSDHVLMRTMALVRDTVSCFQRARSW